jgi:hypothetical protein
MNIALRLIWSHIPVLLMCSLAAAQEPLFDGHGLTEVELRGPLRTTLRDDRKRDERPFTISVAGEPPVPVEVRVRGKSRAQKCPFPPLRLDFATQDTAGTVFEGLDKVKLVTHCRDRERYERNVLDEYLAYRIFNLLTERSHRVRLLRIRYVDTERPQEEPVIRLAFALEPIEQVAERLGAGIVETEFVVKSRLEPRQTAIVNAFHYLIGNVDWSLVAATDEEFCCHNGRLLLIDGQHVILPYDFDFAGLVDAPYAKPHASIPIRSVTQRLYRGYCMDDLPLDAALEAITSRRQAILDLVRGLPETDPDETADRIAYLEEFFAEAAGGTLVEEWVDGCIG